MKKKSLSTAFLTAIIISGLFSVVTMHFGTAQSGSQVLQELNPNSSVSSLSSTLTPPTVSLGTPQINGLTVSLNGAAMPTTPGATITQISFDWGNGATTIGWFPQTYTYWQNGTYTINVTSTDSNGLTGSANVTVTVQGPSPTPSPTPTASPSPTPYPTPPPTTNYTAQNFPVSVAYRTYTNVGSGIQVSSITTAGPSAISLGVMNGSASVVVSQGNQLILSTTITSGSFDYVVLSASASYSYSNFYSNGQTLSIKALPVSGSPLIAYNVYNNYITNDTASFITYPPQFAANFGPSSTPVNAGISFLLVVPNFTLPTPLAIWDAEGFNDAETGKGWYCQLGSLHNFDTTGNMSYPFWESFSNVIGNSPVVVDTNYPLVPGETYNFTMSCIYNTTWELAVNGTPINGTLPGFLNTTSSFCNEGADLGLETLTAWGGNVGITNMINIPTVMSFQVNGQWSVPSSFSFGSIGENWWNGNATSAPGIDLWGIAGHLEDSLIPNGALLFNDSLPMILDTPTRGYEPIYGNFSFPQVSSGGSIVTVSKVSDAALQVTPVNEIAYVSIASCDAPNCNITSLTSAKITGPTIFNVPAEAITAVVNAADSTYTQTSSSVINMSSMPTPTPTATPTPTPSPMPVPTATLTLAPTLTPVLIATPTPTASSSPNTKSSPTPAVPEFPSVIILTITLITTATSILFCKRQKTDKFNN